MAKKKVKSKKDDSIFLQTTIYGIFDVTKKDLVKISLDKDEIEMDLALNGEDKNLQECKFDITLALTPG